MQKTLTIDVRPIAETKEMILSYVQGKLGDIFPVAKIVMPNLDVLMSVLSKENLELLKIIRKQQPTSMGQLAALSKRKQSNLSKPLAKMAAYGLVKIHKNGNSKMPTVDYQVIQINLSI